ncbi:hypothetical protein [Kitasatospora sp. NPDC056181]|uniref:hypothetical protein n=1 Tax=Kitasatospora sp. NPDC056181 TaxID=3345737 RepID=UPI0035E19DC2
MRIRWKVVVPLAVVVAVLTAGVGLFYNGYGPMALRDKRVLKLKSPAAAKDRIDEFLRATMAGISPQVEYLGGDYQVTREEDHWDGEPNLKSRLFGAVTIRTRIAQVKLPRLLDQISWSWEGMGCGRVERSGPDKYNPKLTSLSCTTDDGLSVSLGASSDGSYNSVAFSGELDFVRYQPAHEYGPVSPLPTRPRTSGGVVADDAVDDPYWSH